MLHRWGWGNHKVCIPVGGKIIKCALVCQHLVDMWWPSKEIMAPMKLRFKFGNPFLCNITLKAYCHNTGL